ncbi:MAG TPA: tRNA (adenosine(37)-N6)-dimethylallyltransferase MiaA, partial [Mycobacteriales bacterium]|nr:tRNA (adenosine(37)-N6)-dimethylallyltransferase MiaA [Mycobacteriales bacterium]
LAAQLGGEVVNADAMQLYQGMDIGTAKITTEEQAGIPHHLLDVWPVTQNANVADYQQRSREAVDRLLSRGVVPIMVGGSGLYVRSALDEMEFPGTDSRIRARYEELLAGQGSYALHRRLAELDPAAALAILPSNGRRVVRALEVIELTGRPYPATLRTPAPRYPTVYVGVDRAVETLDDRINRRVERMWQAGLAAEVQTLVDQGLRDGPTARRALGYRHVLEMFDGTLTEEDAKAATALRTRQFVRRQRSWFRRDHRITWLDGSDSRLLSQALELVEAGPRPEAPHAEGVPLRPVD